MVGGTTAADLGILMFGFGNRLFDAPTKCQGRGRNGPAIFDLGLGKAPSETCGFKL